MYDQSEQRQAAVRRLNEKRAFSSHVVSYFVINAVLIVIWAATGADYFWPIWPILGWAAGLGLHAWTVFGQRPITEEDIRKETERQHR